MIDPIYPSSNDGAEQRAQKQSVDIWENLQGMLPTRREQRLAFLLFNCGLKPKEIARRCSQEFCDVQEIYRMRRNIIEQFLHNGL